MKIAKLLKCLVNPRVATAIISAISAVICTYATGCKLVVKEANTKGLEFVIDNPIKE